MKVYFGGGQGKRLARKEILQTVGWADTFSSRGRVKGEETSVKGFESRGERMHRDVHVQLFRIDRDISFSSYLLHTVLYSQLYVYLFKHLYFSIPILRIQSPLTYSKIVSHYYFSHCFILYFIKFISFFNLYRIIRLFVKLFNISLLFPNILQILLHFFF